MLRIPNILIHIKSTKNHSFSELRPRWFADCYRAIWGARSNDPENGVKVEVAPYIPGGNCGQFTTYDSVEQAERQTVSVLSAGADEERTKQVVAMFTQLFPQGLAPIIDTILAEELALARRRAAEHKAEVVAPEELLALGISRDQAVRLVHAGIRTGDDLAIAFGTTDGANGVARCGFTGDEMAALESKLAQPVSADADTTIIPAAPAKVANPFKSKPKTEE